ncbi:unnamed protein product [Coccothraustes coccothraustes]
MDSHASQRERKRMGLASTAPRPLARSTPRPGPSRLPSERPPRPSGLGPVPAVPPPSGRPRRRRLAPSLPGSLFPPQPLGSHPSAAERGGDGAGEALGRLRPR